MKKKSNWWKAFSIILVIFTLFLIIKFSKESRYPPSYGTCYNPIPGKIEIQFQDNVSEKNAIEILRKEGIISYEILQEFPDKQPDKITYFYVNIVGGYPWNDISSTDYDSLGGMLRVDPKVKFVDFINYSNIEPRFSIVLKEEYAMSLEEAREWIKKYPAFELNEFAWNKAPGIILLDVTVGQEEAIKQNLEKLPGVDFVDQPAILC